VTRDLYVALHEAAHLVAAIKLGVPVVSATIVPPGHGVAGGVQLGSAGGENVAIACLAGLAASEILLGDEISGIRPDRLAARQDIVNAVAIIKALVDGAEEQERRFNELTDRAEALLIENRCLWDRLAAALFDARSMSWADIQSIVSTLRE